MSNRFVKVPIYPRFFRVDLDEVEAYVARRYQETFGEPPFGVEAEKYPGEIDIVVYVVYAVNPSSLLNSMTKRIILKEWFRGNSATRGFRCWSLWTRKLIRGHNLVKRNRRGKVKQKIASVSSNGKITATWGYLKASY